MKGTKNTKICIIIATILTIATIATIILTNLSKSKTQTEIVEPITNPEILKSLTYEQITPEEEQNQNEHVKFLAFFTRDLNNDGYAEKLKGTCKEISNTDELYIELNVLSDGYLKNGTITVNAGNFIWETAIVSDNIVKGNYVGATTSIKLQDEIAAGSQKILWGTIKANIGNNINNYSKEATITLTGTHVSDDGQTETQINKTVKVLVDWYGTVGAEIKNTSINKDIENIQTTKDTVKFEVDIQTQETNGLLLLKENTIVAEIPKFNGFTPVKVSTLGEYTYDEETRILTAKRTSIVDENGNITQTLAKQQTYTVNIEYPIEAYIIDLNSITLEIPVSTYYIAYNNINEQFENPIKSNIAKDIVAMTYRKLIGYIYEFDIKVGEISRHGYTVSKEKPRRIYNGYTQETTEDYYNVIWELYRGNEGEVSSVIMKETTEKYTDEFLNESNEYFSMTDYTENIGIYFLGASDILGDNGYIRVYNDETSELIHEFTKEDWGIYTSSNIYKYEVPVKHIRIETSAVAQNCILTVNNVKEINDELLVDEISETDFNELSYIYSYLEGSAQIVGNAKVDVTNDIGIANYSDEVSNAGISINKKQIKTEKTLENFLININAIEDVFNDSKWKNGQFIVKLPSEIINTQINKVYVNKENVEIIGYDVYEFAGSLFIKIITQNDEEEEYTITIDCNITPDPSTKTSTRDVGLYAYNQIAEKYWFPVKDIYDVNGNNNLQENVNYSRTSFDFITPSSLITSQYISEFDNNGTIKISPNVVDILREQKTAKINLTLLNNYTQNIDEVKIIGVIPSEGNSYIVNGKELGSQFDVNMSENGIQIPNELKNIVKVYYSEKMNPTKDLSDSNNGWKTNPDDWSTIRTFLIDFGDYIIPPSKSYTFTYEIQIPDSVKYNKVSYSQHAVYFNLDTEGGKLVTQTEPSKLGIRVAKYYNLNLTKYKLYTDKAIGGATYKLIEKDENGNVVTTRFLNTKEDGECILNNLYVERKYTIEEIVAPNNYKLNDDIIDFYVSEDNGNLKINITSEDKFSSEPIIDNEQGIIYVTTEDMPTYNLVINKESLTGEKIEGVQFYVKEKNKFYRTDEKGQILVQDLIPNETYTIEEKKAEGYYVDNTERTFKLVYELNSVKIETNDEELKNAVILNDNTLSTMAMEATILNEKIPTYNLQVLKVAENDENNIGLQGTIFELHNIEDNKSYRLTTDSTGTVNFNDLYAFVKGKSVSGNYILKEIKAPDGYATNIEDINFVVKYEDGKLSINIENEEKLTSYKTSIVEGNTVKIIIQDKPLFKVTKKDSETGEVLANVKFVIYELDENGQEIGYAKDVNENYVGEKNENGDYLVTTDENGVITLPLGNGIYKIVEVEFPEGYEKFSNEEIFKISGNSVQDTDDSEDFVKIEYIEDLVKLSNEVNAGDNKANQKIKLMKTLDFKDANSYKNAEDTSFGDLNGDGSVEGIKAELTDKTDGVGFTPIGKDSSTVFSGIFNGQGYEIRNIYINTNSMYGGLFGYVNEGEICNLGITGFINIDSYGQVYCGGIVGYTNNSNINDNYNFVEINGIADNRYFSSYIGGIVGEANNSSIKNCYNLGYLNSYNYSGGTGGIVGSIINSTIDNCYNNGEIIGKKSVGGISGEADGGNIYNSYNCADIETSPLVGYNGYTYGESGGILGKGSSTSLINNYNTGDITSVLEVSISGGTIASGGILGALELNKSNIIIKNSYNTGDVSTLDYMGVYDSYLYAGGLVGYNSNSIIITNSYNIGDISSDAYAASISNGNLESYDSVYYLDIIEVLGKTITITGNSLSDIDMKSKQFYNTINIDNVWGYRNNNYPFILKKIPENIKETTEITLKNTIKKYKITTEIGYNSEKEKVGGTITGVEIGDIKYVETISHGSDNKQIIEIKNNEDYRIEEITINGEQIDYTIDENEKVIIPAGYFKKITEDKHITVVFEKIDNLIINKVDEVDNSLKLSGAKFKINQSNFNECIGEMANRTNSTTTHHFIKVDDTYESTNAGVSNSVSNSYFPINLSKYSGTTFTLSVNASISSEHVNYDMGYATITTSRTVPTYDSTTGQFIKIGGTDVETKTYTTTLEGGKTYYLHVGYKKDGSVNKGSDKFTINSIDLTTTNEDIGYKKEIITNSEGIASARVPNDIDLSITEIQAPEGYQLNTSIHEIVVPTGEVKEVTITNKEIESNLKLNKIDEETKQPLSLAEFEIYKSNQQKINRNEITYEKQDEIYYIEAEDTNVVSGNPNWKGDEYSGGYGVDLAKDLNFTFNVDETNEYILQTAGRFFYGRNFKIYINGNLYKECNSIGTSYSYGIIDIPLEQLEKGTYTIRLTSDQAWAPIYDYFKIYSNSSDYSYFINLPSDFNTHKLKINAGISGADDDYGYVEIENLTDGNIERILDLKGNEPLKEYNFELNGSYNIAFKTNSSSAFTVNSIEVDSIGDLITTIITDENGNSKVNLPLGSYLLKETKAPEGYRLSEEPIYVNIDNEEEKITVTNKTSAKHQITTKVEKQITQLVDGGTISGQNELPYEEVYRYEASTKDILIDPDDGYKIKFIKINGTEISFTSDTNGNVLLDKFDNMTEDKEVVVMFTPVYESNFTLVKTDEYTNKPLQGIQFAVYYLSTGVDFAKDLYGQYIGEQDENGMYLVTTDENGEIKLSLPTGNYKAVEVKGADGYVLEEKEEDRTTYFKVMAKADVEISYVEDLIEFANNVTNGDTYEGKTVALTRSLDLNDANCYRNANDVVTYADYNEDGSTQCIMLELTNTAGSGLQPIGTDLNHTFKGIFDGNEFEIKNLYINSSYGALFTSVENGEIRNLKLVNVNSTNSSCGSSLVRNIKNTKIINCSVDGVVRGRTSNNGTCPTGGIVYEANNSIITYCNNKAEVDGVCVGGVVAYSNNSLVENCRNTGKIISNGPVGGLTYSLNGSIVKNSYNTGEVNGSGTSGGLASSVSNSTIENFYNIGKITDEGAPAGGLAQNISNSTLKNCYNMADVYGKYGAGGIASNIYKSDLENCGNSNTINSPYSSTGGIAGSISQSTLKNCYSKGTSTSEQGTVGGIAANITNSTLERCFNENTVYSESSPVGGIAYDVKNSTFTECYNKGNVSSNASGSNLYIAGFASNIKDSKLVRCYNEGNVESLYNAAGISASNVNTDLEDCYNTGEIKGSYGCAGISTDISDSEFKNVYNTGNITAGGGTVGGIASYITDSILENCANTGNVSSGPSAGGIAGSCTNSTIIRCYNTGISQAGGTSAGLINSITNSLVQDCYNEGEVKTSVPSGGIAYNISGTTINNSYNVGKVNGNYGIGGIVGYASGNSTINNCYNAGELVQSSSGDKLIGGIVYTLNNSTLTNTYYLKTTSSTGIYNKSNVVGVTESMTKVAMQSRLFKTSLNNNKDKIETNIPLSNWVFKYNDYPTLDFEVDMSAIEIELPELPNVPTDNTNSNITTEQSTIIPNYEEVSSELNITNSKSAKIIVHHYLESTGPEYETEPTILAQDEIIMGKENYNYSTSPKLDIEGYTLIKDVNGEYIIPKNASGKFTEDEQHIYYYYNLKPLELIVHHYLDGTEDKLTEDELYYYNENEHYKTTPSEDLLEAYEVASVVGDEEKDITENEVVTYYYKHKKVKIITKVEIPASEAENGRTEKGGEISGEGEESYEIVNYGENSTKDIIATPYDGYKLGSITVNGKVVPFTIKEGKVHINKFEQMKEDKEVVVTFVQTTGKVITHHYLKGTAEKLHEDIISLDKIGAVVKTEPINIEGYKLVDSTGNKDEDGNVVIVKEVAEGVEEIIYYYENCYIITTDVIEHEENNKDGTVKTNVKGGYITNEDVVIHEQVVRNDNSKNVIDMKPDNNYEIVEVRINENVVGFEEKEYENDVEDGSEEGSENENNKVTISSKLYIDEIGNMSIPAGFFQEVQENIHVEVKYRRKSKVIVKYLDKETETELSSSTEIIGHEGKEFKTSSKIIPGYTLAKVPVSEGSTEFVNLITDENKKLTNSNGTMFSDDITIIYWYERIDTNIIERHIETNAKGEQIELETIIYKDSTATNVETKRKVYEKYNSTDVPEDIKEEIKNNYPNVTIARKDENKVTVELDTANVKEIWYYYVKQYNITTEVKKHKEIINGVEKEVEGGTISKEYKTDENGKQVEVTYEVVNSRADSTKEIKIVPESGYRIKSVTINDEQIFIDNMIEKDGSLTLPVAYFKDIQQDYNIVVEFKQIPSKVIVKYIDEFTKESIIPDKVVEGFVNNEYSEPRVEIDGYIAAKTEPENNKGIMTEDVITIVYYYGKQFKITTDVIEHLEDKENRIVDVVVDMIEEVLGVEETNGSDNNASEGGSVTVVPEGKVLVKGGTIQGEDEQPYETVSRGKDNAKQILIKPDFGYRIKSVKLKDGENEYILSVPDLLTKENTIILPIKYFKNIQSDKHISVEFEQIPAKVVVNYFDIETKDNEKPEKVSKQEFGQGFVNYDYRTYEKQVPYYEIVKEELPENAVGKITSENTIVNYWYRKLLFNMKLKKEFSSIQVNGVEMLKDNKKFAKIDITNTEVDNTNILVKYKIAVTNTEEVEGIASIVENIPVGFKFIPTENTNVCELAQWKEVDGKLQLTTRTIKPGETVEYEITLQWDKTLNCMGTLKNTALINQIENIPQYKETTEEDNTDSCTLVLAVRTREDRDVKEIISMSCFMLAGICTVVYVGTEIYARRKENE